MIRFIKKNIWNIILSNLFCLLPILAGLYFWDSLPELLPIHWNMQGETDNYATKALVVFGLPIFMTLLNILCIFATQIDNRGRGQNAKIMTITFWVFPMINIFAYGMTLSSALGITFNPIKYLPVILGVLFLIIGNYLPKLSYNRTIGIRIPTTLYDEENWDRTHYFAGKIWVISSFLMMLTAFLPIKFLAWAFIPIALIMVLVPIIYSVIIANKE